MENLINKILVFIGDASPWAFLLLGVFVLGQVYLLRRQKRWYQTVLDRRVSVVAPIRTPDLKHHVVQGTAWLTESARGANTAALSYAAFEFRLAIERLAVHYWAELLGRKLEENDLRDIKSFKRIERRIRGLGGHQMKINGHFEFMRVVLGLLKINVRLLTPNLGQLSKHWGKCSELCHIGWSLACGDSKFRTDAFITLEKIQGSLANQAGSLVTWPIIHDAAFADLRNRFVSGLADPGDVRAYLEKTGAWASVEYKDGRAPEFAGEAIPPREPEESA